jgi:uncharacterized membrane protein
MGETQNPEKKLPPSPASMNQEVAKQELAKLEPNKEKRDKIISLVTQFSYRYSGPLPAPNDLEKYNNIVPGLAERIVKMVENQNTHRIETEDSVIKSQLAESKRGQYIGFIIAVMCIGATILLALNNHDSVAVVLGGTTILGLVTVFVTGKKEQKTDLAKKSGN